MLTAVSTVLGMIPIAPTVFWGPMAFAIMGGLLPGFLSTATVFYVFAGAAAVAARAAGTTTSAVTSVRSGPEWI